MKLYVKNFIERRKITDRDKIKHLDTTNKLIHSEVYKEFEKEVEKRTLQAFKEVI